MVGVMGCPSVDGGWWMVDGDGKPEYGRLAKDGLRSNWAGTQGRRLSRFATTACTAEERED